MATGKRKYNFIVQNDFYEQARGYQRKTKKKSSDICLLFFNQLPDEIVLMILSYLNKSSIVSFGRTCRRFYLIAYHPSLWRRVDMSHKRTDAEQLKKLLLRSTSTLKLYQTTIEDSEYITIRNSSLKYLDLTSAILSSDLLSQIINSCRSLKKLSLESLALNKTIIEKVVANEQLDTLNVSMCTGITDESITLLTKKLLLLRSLNISWTNLSSTAIEHLCDNIPRCIEQLNISGHRHCLKDDHILRLVRRTSRLRYLDISDSTLITDQSISTLRQYARVLVHLSASRCYQLTGSSLAHLKLLPAFSMLDIFGTLPFMSLQQLREEIGSRIRLNTCPFSSIARPTTGIQRTSIWGLRTRP